MIRYTQILCSEFCSGLGESRSATQFACVRAELLISLKGKAELEKQLTW